MNPENSSEKIDQATSRRLSRLRSMPVETSRLDAMIESQIPRLSNRPIAIFFRLRAVRAVAASLAMFGIIGAILWSLSGGAVLASPDMMAQFHDELLSGKMPLMQVDSIAEANKALADSGVQIPQIPTEHAMLCCMHSIKDKRVACVLLKNEGSAPITLAVAKAMDMRVPPDARPVIRNGMEYHVQNSADGKLHMVMAERDGRWICLISELPSDRLMEIAGQIRF